MQTEKLFIGNATRQVIDFHYRVAQGAPIRVQPIPPGTQIQISGDLTPAQVDFIVRSQAKYGVVAADAIDQARVFHGTCYSIGKPITGMRLIWLMDHNLGQLVKLGREIREMTAVAQNNAMETALIENGRSERLTQFDLTIQQENQDGNNAVPQLSEGFRVIRNDNPPPPRKTGARRKAA